MTHKYKNMGWEQVGDVYVLKVCASDIYVYIKRWGSSYLLTLNVAGFKSDLVGYTKLSSAIRGAYRALKRLYDVTQRLG